MNNIIKLFLFFLNSNMSSVSTTSCFYGQQRSVTPASSICSSAPGTSASVSVRSSPFSGIGSQAVPSNIPYQGQYGFQMGFESQTKDTKSVTWTYSQVGSNLIIITFKL